MTVLVGTSGWSYNHWEPELYPHGLPARDRLPRYVAAFPTAELNSSFYRWPSPAQFSSWRGGCQTGSGSRSRRQGGSPTPGSCSRPRPGSSASGRLARLDGKRAVLLVQLAPSHARDDARLDYFLRLLPGWIRVAVEFRHPSWHCEEIFALLAEHAAAYCVMSGADLPCVLRATTDFVYVRMHGPDQHHLYAGSYSDADLSGGPTAYENGARPGRTSSPTSTTTATPTQCGTPERSRACSPPAENGGVRRRRARPPGGWRSAARPTCRCRSRRPAPRRRSPVRSRP